MLIDATRYNMFWTSPEKYRLREVWKLAPVEPKPGTLASLLTYGRRRGTCFHELLDGRAKGLPVEQSVQELYDGGFGAKEVMAATRMLWAVQDLTETLAHEVTFKYDIPGTPHTMTGRVDSIIREYEETLILDYKTSKDRSKTDCSFKLEQYCRSAQVSFYLLGARTIGFDPAGFIYRLVVDGKAGVRIIDRRTERTNMQLAEFARGVAMTCDIIEFMKATYGIEKAWPQLPSPFDSDYQSIAGRKMFVDYIPEGFIPKVEHLSTMETPNAL